MIPMSELHHSFLQRQLNHESLHKSFSYQFVCELPDGEKKYNLDFTPGDGMIKVCIAKPAELPSRVQGKLKYPYHADLVEQNPYFMIVDTNPDSKSELYEEWPVYVKGIENSVAVIQHVGESSALRRDNRSVGYIQGDLLNRRPLKNQIKLNIPCLIQPSEVLSALNDYKSEDAMKIYRSVILATWAADLYKPAGV